MDPRLTLELAELHVAEPNSGSRQCLAIARWPPIPSELLDLDGERLAAGAHARVSGAFAGPRSEFDVEIHEADEERLSLVANGLAPIGAEYQLAPADGGSDVRASVSVSGRGLLGGILARAFEPCSPLERCVPPSHGSAASWNPHLLETNQDHTRRRLHMTMITRTHHKTTPATADQPDLGVAARVTVHEARRARTTNMLLWAMQILLAAFFVFAAALPKLTGGGSHGSVQEFGLIGAGQWFRYFVGTVELAGGIGLLIPRLAGLAAAGLAADMAGATIINATVLNGTRYDALGMTAVLCAVFVLLAYGRRQQIKGLAVAIRR